MPSWQQGVLSEECFSFEIAMFITKCVTAHLYFIYFTVVTVLGDPSLYPECKNHRQLQQPWRKHVFNQPGPEDDHDGNLEAGWYRIDGQAGRRLLDITDIPRNIFNRTLVRLIL